jgi:hypothetical protein
LDIHLRAGVTRVSPLLYGVNQQQSKAGIGRNAIAGELRSKQDLVNAKVVTDKIASECAHAQRDNE